MAAGEQYKLHCLLSILLLIQCVSYTHGNNDQIVQWQVSSDPVVFGELVTLSCTCKCAIETARCCDNQIKEWHDDRLNRLITRDGKTAFPSKYRPVDNGTMYSLQIFDLEENDINKPYTCFYGFTPKSNTLNPKSYEKYPTNLTTEVQKQNVSGGIYSTIVYKSIYPEPVCHIEVDNMILINQTVSNKTETGIFFDTQIIVNYTFGENECGKSFRVLCKVGHRTYIPINGTSDTCIPDDGNSSGHDDIKTAIIIIVVIIVIVVIVVVLVVLVIFKKRKQPNDYTVVKTANGINSANVDQNTQHSATTEL